MRVDTQDEEFLPMITMNTLKGLGPKDRPYKLGCGNGLQLEVTPTGSKLWRYRYRFGGKEKLISLGRFTKVSLKAARELRDEQREILDSGENPSEYRRREPYQL